METIVFHFNKAHITDPQGIPPWVIKYKGETHYVWHVNSEVGFSTKETPDNPHTKGSIKFKGNLELKEVDNKLIARITRGNND